MISYNIKNFNNNKNNIITTSYYQSKDLAPKDSKVGEFSE